VTKGGIIFGGVLPTFAFGLVPRRGLLPSTSGSLSHKSPAVLQKGHKETHPFRSGLPLRLWGRATLPNHWYMLYFLS
jgi:hypothetical protein